MKRLLAGTISLSVLIGIAYRTGEAQNVSEPTQSNDAKQVTRATLTQYCMGCHNDRVKTGGVVLDPAGLDRVADQAEVWERVVRQVRAESMPPAGAPRPNAAAYASVLSYLTAELDRAAADHPQVGPLPQLHRLTRTEYANVIHDLLGIEDLPKELDYQLLLPEDNSASGFDNVADLLFMSPVVMERYLEAARKLSRLAVGDPKTPLMVNVHVMPQQLPQDTRMEDLPFGTRGGLGVKSYFPLDGEYTFTMEMAGGGRDVHELELLIDGERVATTQVGGGGGPRGRGAVRQDPEFRAKVKAGPRMVGVTFVEKTEALNEAVLKPRTRTRGTLPAVGLVTIRGPYNATGPGETPSRERIFVCQPQDKAEEDACARKILSNLARRAYRRPVNDQDLADLLPFYVKAKTESGFEFGIQKAVERVLVSPQFLYRIEREPAGAKKGDVFRVSDLELASRLSFLLWSSQPDEELLKVAEDGSLHETEVLTAQVERMLADPKSEALVTNFAAQWLYLRDVAVKEPDLLIFRDFDEGLRESFEKETSYFLDSVLREDRSVMDLIGANYSFLNERLADHYGVPNVTGSYFRKVEFPQGSPRGGLLGQGGILTLTSYAIRTSPVLRGKYVLENLLASPPPPPPPNVPALKTESTPGETMTMREAMQLHRANPVCASCHARMDPIGFAMENFDAVGRWRDLDSGQKIDSSGVLTDGTKFEGVAGLKQYLLSKPDRFVGAMAERLLMYALGRNVQYYDQPAVRAIVKKAEADQYRFRALIRGVVESAPFQMRTAVQ